MPKPSLIDAVHAASRRNGPPCGFIGLRAELPADVANDLDALLADPTVTTAAIWRGLRELGYYRDRQMLVRHRRGECGCAH